MESRTQIPQQLYEPRRDSHTLVPAQRRQLRDRQTHAWNNARPTAISTWIFKWDLTSSTSATILGRFLDHRTQRIDTILEIYGGVLLATIPKDSQTIWIIPQLFDVVRDDRSTRHRANNVREPKYVC